MLLGLGLLGLGLLLGLGPMQGAERPGGNKRATRGHKSSIVVQLLWFRPRVSLSIDGAILGERGRFRRVHVRAVWGHLFDRVFSSQRFLSL